MKYHTTQSLNSNQSSLAGKMLNFLELHCISIFKYNFWFHCVSQMGKDLRSSSGFIHKKEVLDVKPLRAIFPVFPEQSSIPSLAGSFQPGVAPFYPFLVPNESQVPTKPNQAGPSNFDKTIPSPVPLNSYRTPSQYSERDSGPSRRETRSHKGGAAVDDGNSNYHRQSDQFTEGTSKKQRGRSRQKTTAVDGSLSKKTIAVDRSPSVDLDNIVAKSLKEFRLIGLEPAQQADGNKELINLILMVYNLLRRRIVQFEESRGDNPGFTRRPDMTAGNMLMSKGIRTNKRKIIGAVPGIEVGDIFFFRMEMSLVGLHAPVMAGIDYMGVNVSTGEEPLAVSIVSSAGYEDKNEDENVLIYSGQGGLDRKDGKVVDQKLDRGNLALETSLHRANEVRVIRGLKDIVNGTGKVYMYDGLYKIHESWREKGKGGCNVFKYKLVRIPKQPKAFTLWKSIQPWKDGATLRTYMILPDLTSGKEILPVCLVNDVDDERGPAYFTYTPFLKYKKSFDLPRPSSSCTCRGGCQPGDTNCPCIRINEGFIPYISPGVLVSRKTMIHECGSSCLCPLTCRNRVTQAGLKVRLEVFKTKNRGWGLRSWDPIRSGQFICVHGGEVIDTSKTIELGSEEDTHFIFDSTRIYPSLKCLPDGNPGVPFSLVLNAYSFGNVARFMNHSCSPNVFWQPVLRENNNESYLGIAFYALGHISPLQELTFDYGVAQENTQMKKNCLCGSSQCRGFFY
ncbi:histone-lysine N-methyltransferase, H3 lysine-9 specific SUVH1-like [Heracleum sosnowskyi]|uniref:Histone-lysine N-methyltransferase, H3 lysine-9 specific SUVH1-like n=1 Tax=Heracleum sosnowskyi TaxID=360622 RepID=A0AAD8M8C4_9APIA|nr:histone-lysine N-methyltransferase, H3 lysine-9 specific SUVH1-like [Heracleum sosnowskyi]